MNTPRTIGAWLVTILVASGALLPLGSSDAASVPACGNADLTATYRGGDAATSHVFGRIVLTNSSDHACRTGGYGGLSYVGGGDGTQIGAAADRTPGTVRVFVLQPGQRVHSPVVETSFAPYPKAKCHPRHVDGFRVYVPNETKSQFIAHPTTGCANTAVHLLSHKPYRR
jgi:hypothetical protein